MYIFTSIECRVLPRRQTHGQRNPDRFEHRRNLAEVGEKKEEFGDYWFQKRVNSADTGVRTRRTV